MDWIGSKLKRLTDAVKFQLGNPRCFNCPKPGVSMLYDNTQYIVCDNQWCHVAASQKYQHELSKFIAVLSAIIECVFIQA